jgi:hypothetical protein
MKHVALIAVLGGLALAAPAAHAGGGGLYGTVTTLSGDSHTGKIRWDKNENYWDDYLDARKNDEVEVAEEGGLDLRVFGLQVLKTTRHGKEHVRSQFSIPVGHIREIEAGHGDLTRITLKNGETVEVRNTGDLGRHMRGVTVTGASGEVTELAWEDLDRVEFAPNPDTASDDSRLWGTVETSVGSFTGAVVWDRDESEASDILDGDEGGHRRKIPFGRIESIEPLGKNRARVVLRTGKDMVLSGTNDVNSQNRGIEVTLEGLGKVEVGWEQLRKVTFTSAPDSRGYDAFDGGAPIRGVVTTRDGREMRGEVIWDRDERRTWESLDGEMRGVKFQILFGNIARIDRASEASAKVTMRDGLSFDLSGSNDVNDENKGIGVIAPDGTSTEVTWEELASVDFTAS